jgi:hypothetical protein
MIGFEWRELSAVVLGYYQVNARGDRDAKKGNNGLAALGLGFTPLDEPGRMVSFQVGLAAEVHERDVQAGKLVAASGGAEFLASPTVVWGPSRRLRFFLYGSIPFAQSYRATAQEDRWRAGAGIIRSF